DSLAQVLGCDIALDVSAGSNADAAGLLGDDHGNGVSFLGDPDARAMPSPQLLRQLWVRRQRQEAWCRSDAVLLHNYRSVMQRGVFQEDGSQQVVGQVCVQRHAAVNVVA